MLLVYTLLVFGYHLPNWGSKKHLLSSIYGLIVGVIFSSLNLACLWLPLTEPKGSIGLVGTPFLSSIYGLLVGVISSLNFDCLWLPLTEPIGSTGLVRNPFK